MEILALIISIVSAITAVASAIFTYRQNKRLNVVNIKAHYYEKIFDDYLIHQIPQSRKYLRFDGESLTDGQKLLDTLSEMRTDALYFKYDNRDFYKELTSYITDVEDYICTCGNKKFEQEEQAEVWMSIQKQMERIYSCIHQNYTGGLSGGKRRKKKKE